MLILFVYIRGEDTIEEGQEEDHEEEQEEEVADSTFLTQAQVVEDSSSVEKLPSIHQSPLLEPQAAS